MLTNEIQFMPPQQKIFDESNIYGPCEANLLLFTGCRLPTIHFNAGNKQSSTRVGIRKSNKINRKNITVD